MAVRQYDSGIHSVHVARYEDEEDFDAIADILQPKRVFLVPACNPGVPVEAIRTFLGPVSFQAAFTSPQV
jgi:hypothetical protein